MIIIFPLKSYLNEINLFENLDKINIKFNANEIYHSAFNVIM
jgi:hypothetical protein